MVCLQLRRPGDAKIIYHLTDLSKIGSSKASTEKGTREPRQSRVPHSQSPISTTSMCHNRRGFPQPPQGLPTLPTPFSQALLHPPAPSPAFHIGALPACEALRAPASLTPPPRNLSPSLSAAPIPHRFRSSPPHSLLLPPLRSERREQLPWASPPLVSTPMAFPVPERFSKNFGW